MSKTFVIGDIHGAYRAFIQCLHRASFDYENDSLISLGDVADGWPETSACIDELLKIKHLTYIIGNHDLLTLEWMETGIIKEVWFNQGGKATMDSYKTEIVPAHVQFLKNALPYYQLQNKLFVHAGINPALPIQKQSLETLVWDRELARSALYFFQMEIKGKLTQFDEVYIGHTPTTFNKPIESCGIWLMDTGAGWHGKLSIMNIDTKEFFTSDPVPSLYPGIEGRKKKT